MGGSECCVKNCGRSSHDHRGKKLSNGLTFHCFPAWRTNEGGRISELTRRRRAAWVAAVSRSDITFNCIPASMRVCSRHFHSGKPAYEMLDLDPDWAPSLHLGHNEGKSSKSGRPSQSKKKRKRRLTEERPAEGFNGRFDGQREAGVLLREDEPNQPEDQEQNQPAEKRTNISFRDFFRNALEASLEASIRSKAQSKNRSLSSEYEVELNLKLPPAADEECSSSSTCLNCVRLQKRIQELENKLFRLTADQQDVDPSLGPIEQEPIPSPDEDEEENFDEGECVSPSQVALQIIDEDSKSASSLFDWHPSSSGPPSSSLPPSIPSGRHRPPPRFRKEWLSQFPFLRYSQSQDVMWCHVCRIQSDETHQNLGLIKGSKDFKKSSLNKHSNTKYHRDNMERYSWSCKL